MKNLLVRSLSGLVYTALIILCLLTGSIPFNCLAVVLAALATFEFEKITRDDLPPSTLTLVMDIVGNILLVFSWMLVPVVLWAGFMLIRMIVQLYLKDNLPIRRLSVSFMSQIYIGVPVGCMTCIGEWCSLHFVLALFFMIWINDTGAFLVGSSCGRHRLFERISPKKSWEGFFGGLVFNIVASWAFYTFCNNFFSVNGSLFLKNSLIAWIGLGILVTAFATWGDLVESMFKRSLNIKDSGNIIPGHGGILDRIDSLLFVMPASLIYIIFLNML